MTVIPRLIKYHKMKKLVLAVVLVSCTIGSSYSQSIYKEEVDAVQDMFGKNKKELITGLIKMAPDEAAKFWPVYDEYEVERKELGKKRIAMLENLTDAYKEMSAAKADLVSKETIKLALETDKMLERYYGKMRTATTSEIAFEFLQAEVYILTEIRSKLMDEIPLYSNIKKGQ